MIKSVDIQICDICKSQGHNKEFGTIKIYSPPKSQTFGIGFDSYFYQQTDKDFVTTLDICCTCGKQFGNYLLGKVRA